MIKKLIKLISGGTSDVKKPVDTVQNSDNRIHSTGPTVPEETLNKLQSLIPIYTNSLAVFKNNPELFQITVKVDEAESVWKILYENRIALNYYPVIVGELNSYGDSPLTDKDLSEDPDVETIFKERQSAFLNQGLPEEDQDEYKYENHYEDYYVIPDDLPELSQTHFDILTSDRSSEHITILFIPGHHGYNIFRYIAFGNWNECPEDREQRAILKHWNEKYGATLATIRSDTLEFYLENPITDENVALELAKEHFIYCEDSVLQGAESIGRLARTILDSHFWFFWWD